jgi:aryl-alcohol dehydrogenase-like predicted oxidoreductase
LSVEPLRTHRFKRTGKRSEIFLASKFGAGSPSGKVIDCSPAYAREAINKSLEKLGVDYIDLYYAHR